jgi:mRNA deadenylase 3'-5' endonuclease subunit Ccr4
MDKKITAAFSFSVASYNVLASAYIQPALYRRTPSIVLNPSWRIPALLEHITRLQADIICLQEVEDQLFAALRSRMGASGYGAQYCRKSNGQPDGCAVFFRQDVFDLIDVRVIAYKDGRDETADSGNIALVILFETVFGRLGIVNTHMSWDPPDTAPELQRGFRQVRQLLIEQSSIADAAKGWIIAGDFNAVPGSESISLMQNAGFHYAHCGIAGVSTCNVNGTAKMIDYLFCSSSLTAEPLPVSPVDDRTVLPSAEQPSDHVSIAARFSWLEETR